MNRLLNLDDMHGPDWFRRNSLFIVRFFTSDVSMAQSAERLKLSVERAMRLVTRTAEFGKQQIGLEFAFSRRVHDNEFCNTRYPVMPSHIWVRHLAGDIADKIETLAREEPRLVEDVVLYYATSVQRDNRLTYKTQSDAPPGRQLVRFVQNLHLNSIWARLNAFTICGQKPSNSEILDWQGAMELPQNVKNVHFKCAHNRDCEASMKRFGLDVACKSKNGKAVLSSASFRYAMTIAAISEIWDNIPTHRDQRKKRGLEDSYPNLFEPPS